MYLLVNLTESNLNDAAAYREHAAKIRRLVAGVRGHAATAALLLADEYEARAIQLEGKPAAASYLASADRIGELIAEHRSNIAAIAAREADLTAELAQARQRRALAEARVEGILHAACLFDMPDLPRNGIPARFEDAESTAPSDQAHSNGINSDD